MNNNKFLFFDTETTGVSRDSYLVQVAWFLTYADGEIISKNEFIIKPDGYEIPYRVSLIHGITTSRAHEEGKALDLALEAFTEDADKAEHIVGHNISFDLAIMQTAYDNASMEFPLNGKIKFDTMTASTQWCQLPKASGKAGYKRPKLSELHYKLFGEYFDNAHSAYADTEATMRSFFKLLELDVVDISLKSKVQKINTGRKVASNKLKRNNFEKNFYNKTIVRQRFNKKKNDLELSIKAEDKKLKLLGKRPVEVEESTLQSLLWLAYTPFPLGWLIWFGALNTGFDPNRKITAFILISLLVAGYISSKGGKDRKKSFDILNKPFLIIDNKLHKLESELKEVEKNLSLD